MQKPDKQFQGQPLDGLPFLTARSLPKQQDLWFLTSSRHHGTLTPCRSWLTFLTLNINHQQKESEIHKNIIL